MMPIPAPMLHSYSSVLVWERKKREVRLTTASNTSCVIVSTVSSSQSMALTTGSSKPSAAIQANSGPVRSLPRLPDQITLTTWPSLQGQVQGKLSASGRCPISRLTPCMSQVARIW